MPMVKIRIKLHRRGQTTARRGNVMTLMYTFSAAFSSSLRTLPPVENLRKMCLPVALIAAIAPSPISRPQSSGGEPGSRRLRSREERKHLQMMVGRGLCNREA